MKKFVIAKNLSTQGEKDLNEQLSKYSPSWITKKFSKYGDNIACCCYVEEDKEKSFIPWYENTYDILCKFKSLSFCMVKPSNVVCVDVANALASAKTFIHKGKKVLAKSYEEAVEKIEATLKETKVIASIDNKMKSWFKTTFAGAFKENGLDEESILGSDKYLGIMYNWLSSFCYFEDDTWHLIADTDSSDLEINKLNDLRSFEDFEKYLREIHAEGVADDYENIVSGICKDMKELGVDEYSLFDSLIQRLINKVPVDYKIDKVLDTFKYQCFVRADVTNPTIMKAVFGTDDIAKIADNITKKKYEIELQDAFELLLDSFDKDDTSRSFEKTLLLLNKNLGKVQFKYLSEFSLREILSSKDIESGYAIPYELAYNSIICYIGKRPIVRCVEKFSFKPNEVNEILIVLRGKQCLKDTK